MKSWLVLVVLTVVGAGLVAEVPVVFKVFPREYELFSQGNRLSFDLRSDGNRVYRLPAGKVRVNLSAPDTQPLSLQLDIKDGQPMVEQKLEPRAGLLQRVAEGPTGRLPRSVAFSPDGKKLYVALSSEAFIEAYDIPSLKLGGKLVPSNGNGGFTDLLVLADVQELWALQTDGNIQIFDLKSSTWKQNVAATGGGNVYFLPRRTGTVGFYNAEAARVTWMDVASRKTVQSSPLSATPRGAGVSGSTVYISLFDAGRLAVMDSTTGKVTETWAAGKAPRPVSVVGNALYVGDMGAAQVLVYSLSDKKLTGTVAVGSNPHAMTVSADGKWAALATRGKNNPNDYTLPGPDYGQVYLLDAKGNIAASVWGRNQPTGLAFSADGQYLAFTDLLDANLELYKLR